MVDLISKMRMKIGRLIISVLPKNFVFIILKGDLRGKKWLVSSSNPGIVLGINDENELINLIKRKLKSNSVFYDVGANVGFFSLLASKYAYDGKIVSFEPFPENLKYLKKNLSINNVNNFEIIDQH